MTHRTKGRLALGAAGALAALVGFAIAVAPGLAGGVASRATTGTGTTEAHTKVLVCHKAKVTIDVSTNAWPAHHRHGDTAGACTPAQSGTAKAKHAEDEDEEDEAKGEAKGTVKGHSKAKSNGNGKAKGTSRSSST